jgi:Putative zinc-finger
MEQTTMDWNCTLTEERLSDYLDATLLPEEASVFSAHAAGCAHCTRLVAQVGGLVSRMQHLAPVEAPPALIEKILDSTLGPRAQKRAEKGWFGWVRVIWQPRFAMGLATAAASVVIVLHAAGTQAGKSSLNPLNLIRSANRQIHLTYAHGAKFVNDLRFVYEIQSRLSSQPDNLSEPISQPMSEPAGSPSGEPQPQQDQQQPAPTQHEKSQTIPHSTRQEPRDRVEVAMLLTTSFTDSSSHDTLRSPL